MYNFLKGNKMKKLFMMMVATMMAMTMNAQGYVGGGIGFGTYDNGNHDVTSFKFLPEVGYSFNDEWSAGVVLGWSGINKGNPKTWTFNPYARYTFVKGKMVSVFADASVGFNHTYNAGHDDDELQIGLKPGVAVSLGERLSFVTHFGFIGYDHLKNNTTKAKNDYWGVDVDGNNVTFGLYYSF